jgi:arylsulfatase A-like enzyme
VQPNILLVVCDALRADHLDLYGYPQSTAPLLSEWAGEALVFEQATAPSNWTRPSMHSLFTGRFAPPGRMVNPNEPIPDYEPVLPELLRAAGYATIAVSANPVMSPTLGAHRGFEQFESVGWSGEGHSSHWKREIAAEVVIDKVAELLRARPADGRPLFLYIHLMDTHLPYDPPDEHRVFCDPAYAGLFDGRSEPYLALRGNQVDRRLPPEDKQQVIALYDGEIRQLDASLAQLRALAGEHLGDRPLLTVVTADHGEAFGEGELGAYIHGVGMTDALLHVPLIVHGAGRAGRIAERVGLVDLMPTLLERSGVEVPGDIDGVNLLGPDGGSLARAGRVYLSYRAQAPDRTAGDKASEGFGELAFSCDDQLVLRTDAPLPQPFAAVHARWHENARRRAAAGPALDAAPVSLPEDAQRRLEALGYTGK